jgi:hypothetical protein
VFEGRTRKVGVGTCLSNGLVVVIVPEDTRLLG